MAAGGGGEVNRGMDAELQRRQVFEFWVELSRARHRREVFEQEMFTNPWESNDPQVMLAWDRLTNPVNLDGLELWGAEPDKMNPVACEATAKAIEHCRKRSRLTIAT